MSNPYKVTQDLEASLCQYTGSRFAVCVNSCSAAIFLSCLWLKQWLGGNSIILPKRTYVSVPQAVIHAGYKVVFDDIQWRGWYQLSPLPVWDSARRFTSGMYRTGDFQCVSFSSSKILGIEQGGAILHDSPDADKWLRRMRFDGRTEGVSPEDDTFLLGYHLIMLPSIAAQVNLKLHHLPRFNEDLPHYEYPDLSLQEAFK